jgi:hypothetical protein
MLVKVIGEWKENYRELALGATRRTGFRLGESAAL